MPEKDELRARRHCMVVFAYYPAGETRVQREAEALVRSGFEVDVLCLHSPRNGTPPAAVVNGVRVHRLPIARKYRGGGLFRQFLEYLAFFFAVMFALIRLQRCRRYDVVQVHNLPDFLIFAAWFPRLLGARLILDLHDLMPEFAAALSGRKATDPLIRLIRLQERLSCAFADHVITVTERWRQSLIERGVRSDRVSVVMNLPDDRVFSRRPDSETGREAGVFHLLYHGAVVPRYGLDLVLEAIARLDEEISGLRCTIHGGRGDEYGDSLVKLAHRLGIASRVRFSMALYPIAELPGFISSADVGLVPYRRDGFTDGILPTKLMEYVAVGVPAIVARTPAIEDYFDDSMVEYFEAGSVGDLAARIRQLYRDRERRTALSRESDRFNRRYNWTVASASYVALVEELAVGRRRAFARAS